MRSDQQRQRPVVLGLEQRNFDSAAVQLGSGRAIAGVGPSDELGVGKGALVAGSGLIGHALIVGRPACHVDAAMGDRNRWRRAGARAVQSDDARGGVL